MNRREEGREEETNKESTTRGGHEHFLNDSLIFYFEIFNFESFLSSAQQKKTQSKNFKIKIKNRSEAMSRCSSPPPFPPPVGSFKRTNEQTTNAFYNRFPFDESES